MEECGPEQILLAKERVSAAVSEEDALATPRLRRRPTTAG